MSNNTLIKRLNDEMKKQNWTGRALSLKANLSYNAIHYILSGKNKSTTFEVVDAIASVLDVPTLYLLDENYSRDLNNINSKFVSKEKSSKEAPYDGELYREIMSIVEELLVAKKALTTARIEHFTHHIYSHTKKMEAEGKKSNVRVYADGIIDYSLNRMDNFS